MKLKGFMLLSLACVSAGTFAQQPVFTRQDTLRGSITPERKWWDLTYYHLDITVNPADSTIRGTNTVGYTVLDEYQVMQIDLQPPLILEKAMQDGKDLVIKHDGNAHFIELAEKQVPGSHRSITLQYGGHPKIALHPPWDGGITWGRDKNNKPFVVSTCQGLGASVWWPCKDHMYDEPDSMLISVTVPSGLMDVSNGRLRKMEAHKNKTKTYHWFVANPINNYGVNINIGNYVHWSEKFEGEKGTLDCDYYVMPYNLEKAKEQFKQAPMMLKAFEYWFGPYPFYEDGYKLVEVPYTGMEHQSSVTYGNGFTNGYVKRPSSLCEWGMSFDFIIIHESAHEWFANNITYKDMADMWIHESFGNYSESLYVEYYHGKEAGKEYVLGTRTFIRNDRPIIGQYNVNNEGSGDKYSKGGNILHTLRQLVNDDEKWRGILRGLNETFYHQTVTTQQIEGFFAEKSGLKLERFFEQYLRDTRVPVFEYSLSGKELTFRWTDCVRGFDMPLKVTINGAEKWLSPTGRWTNVTLDTDNSELVVDRNFYVGVMNDSVK